MPLTFELLRLPIPILVGMIALKGVSKSFGENKVIDRLSLSVQQGETLVLLGLSGSGKTTTLKLMNALLSPDSGSVTFRQKDLREWELLALRRQMGYVIQEAGLFPHYSVFDNIALVPQLLHWPRNKIRERVMELLEKLHLPSEMAQKMPAALSGGQRQRVGLARAMAARPPVLLMDEPFGALDPITRKSIRHEFLELDELRETTIVMVTHDVQEAFAMANRIVLMHKGQIVQEGMPADFIESPASAFVSEFLSGDQFLLELKLKGLYQHFSTKLSGGNLNWRELEKLAR